MKKVLFSILSVVILGMSTVACADEISIDNESYHFAAASAEHNDTDGCTPFCVCSCCPGVNVYFSNTSPSFLGVHSLPVYQSNKFQALFEVTSTIWQPPQLV